MKTMKHLFTRAVVPGLTLLAMTSLLVGCKSNPKPVATEPQKDDVAYTTSVMNDSEVPPIHLDFSTVR